MEKIKDAIRYLLSKRAFTPMVTKALYLILSDKMNSIALKQCLMENDYTIDDFKPEAIYAILDYAEIILDDFLLTEEEIRVISLLKIFFQINEGDFYKYGEEDAVERLLSTQLKKMFKDGIDKNEAIMQNDLQTLFGLSYDQFQIIVKKVESKIW